MQLQKTSIIFKIPSKNIQTSICPIIKSLNIFLVLLLIAHTNSAQQLDKIHHSIYVEIFGSGGYYSINYITNLPLNNNLQLQTRTGIAITKLKDYEWNWNPNFIMPFNIGFSYGKRHQLFINLGVNYHSTIVFNPVNAAKIRNSHFSYSGKLGYQFNTKKWFFNIALNPIYSKQEKWIMWPAAGIGYKIN